MQTNLSITFISHTGNVEANGNLFVELCLCVSSSVLLHLF